MAVYRRSTRPRFTLLLLVLTSITLITLDYRSDAGGVIDGVKGTARDAFAPVESAAGSVFEPVDTFFSGIFNYGDLQAENVRLREQLAESRGAALEGDELKRELKALVDLLDLDFIEDIPTVAARVTSTQRSNFEATIEINRGTSSGVARGMPVVAGAGLVGRVVDVSRTRAVVLLLTDRGSSVGVRVNPSGDVGVARGVGRDEPMEVELIAAATPVKVGDVIVTSGLQQSIYPPGIPIGRVRSTSVRRGESDRELSLTPVVDLRRLQHVRVLQWSPGAN